MATEARRLAANVAKLPRPLMIPEPNHCSLGRAEEA
jgi:hypothetical protein